jgi:hypothetical protein
MIEFLRRPAGRWAVRGLGLGFGWVLATQVLGMAWDGDGHAFLVAMLLIVVVAIAYAMDQIVALVLSFAPAGTAQGKPRFSGPIPPLAKAKQAKVRRMHAALLKAGAFAPQAPPVDAAFPALAVDRQPVGWVVLLDAYANADYYLAAADPAQWLDNILFSRLPEDWENPPPGKRWALLWEDETIILALLADGAVATLNAIEAEQGDWAWLDAAAAAQVARSGFLISTND